MADPRTVVVIGGTSGIGRVIAIRFAQDGARVVVAGRELVARLPQSNARPQRDHPLSLSRRMSPTLHRSRRWRRRRYLPLAYRMCS
jgi:NAD(P)-dependent dehydrogenase (short-subunit alcohol dehydrogenase family)